MIRFSILGLLIDEMGREGEGLVKWPVEQGLQLIYLDVLS